MAGLIARLGERLPPVGQRRQTGESRWRRQLQVGGQRGADAEKGRRFIVFSSSFLTKARGDQGEEKPFLPGCGRLVGRGGSLPIPILVGRTGGRKGVCWLEIKPPPLLRKAHGGTRCKAPSRRNRKRLATRGPLQVLSARGLRSLKPWRRSLRSNSHRRERGGGLQAAVHPMRPRDRRRRCPGSLQRTDYQGASVAALRETAGPRRGRHVVSSPGLPVSPPGPAKERVLP